MKDDTIKLEPGEEKKEGEGKGNGLKMQRLFMLLQKEVKKKNPRSLNKVFIDAGYSEKGMAKDPGTLFKRKKWQDLLRKHAPADRGLRTLYDLSGEENDNKENRLKASVEILKLNDAYPTQKKAVVQLFDKVSNVFGEEENG